MTSRAITRRGLLGGAALVAMAAALRGEQASEPRYRIGACDWSLGLRQDPRAFDVAKQVGLDGVQVSFDGGANDLREAKVRDHYAAESRRTGVAIASLAMGVLNRVPYATDPNAERWVGECIDVMAAMGQKVVLLAFFNKGDINHRPELMNAVAERLKKVAPRAEKAGVVLGIESWMNAQDHVRILDAVGSPAVKVWYDVANSTERGYDIHKEIRWLGAERICQFHCKENGHLLGEGKVDFVKLRETIDATGYRGWLVIESAVGKGMSIPESYRRNAAYLRRVFQS